MDVSSELLNVDVDVETTVICRPGTLRYERVHKRQRYEEMSFSDTYFQSWNDMSCMRGGGYGCRL